MAVFIRIYLWTASFCCFDVIVYRKNYRVWKCTSCSLTENRLSTQIEDVVSERFAELVLRRTTEGGQEVMKIKITNISRVIEIDDQPTAPDFALPTGEFTLIKQ